MHLSELLAGPVELAAPGLLGSLVTANGVTVRLTEVEAYAGVGEDPASHAHRGHTKRNAPMFSFPGQAYVYFVFGVHWCLNVVCGPSGMASAVLLRAGEVVDGLDLARERRGGASSDRDLARGPARLAKSLGVDGRHNGTPMLIPGAAMRLQRPAGVVNAIGEIRTGPRVGVSGAADRPWRFWLAGERTVSAYRKG
jgi:DNA-3-methyladenine glycosylase